MRSERCDMTVHWVCSACHTALRWPGGGGGTYRYATIRDVIVGESYIGHCTHSQNAALRP
jgi:hypothetical protein